MPIAARICLFCLISLAACGPDEVLPDDDAGPEAPDAEPPMPPGPAADGEYVIKVSPTSFACVTSGPQPLETFYAVADIVELDAWTSDLLSGLQGTFVEFDRYGLPRDESGYFLDEREDPVAFWDIILAARRRVEGSADGRTLAFSHRYDLGWYDAEDEYVSECVYEADIHGKLLHERWDGAPKDGVSGQWRVTRTVEESPLDYGQELPYARAAIIRTLEQDPSGSMIEMRGMFRSLSGWPLRDPQTGAVDAYELRIDPYVDSDGHARTMLQETVTKGFVLPEAIGIEQTWHWWTAETDTLPAVEHWFQRERYKGVPRYRPHDRAAQEQSHGSYAARYELVANDCGIEPYSIMRVMDVLPLDDGAVWPRVTGFDREPHVTLAEDGSFEMSFARSTNFWIYDYVFTDARIGGHDVAMTMDVIRREAETGAVSCQATYAISGDKLYMTARP